MQRHDGRKARHPRGCERSVERRAKEMHVEHVDPVRDQLTAQAAKKRDVDLRDAPAEDAHGHAVTLERAAERTVAERVYEPLKPSRVESAGQQSNDLLGAVRLEIVDALADANRAQRA